VAEYLSRDRDAWHQARDGAIAVMRGRAERYRRQSLPERLAAGLPSSPSVNALRRRLRPMFTRLLASSRTNLVATLPDGERFVVAPEHRHVTWNPDEYRAFKAAVHPGCIVFDVGANAGGYSVLFAQWVGPTGQVYAFEPDARAFESLTTHIRLNGVAGWTTASSDAVLDRSGPASLIGSEPPGGSRIASSDADTLCATPVAGVTIDEVCRDLGVLPDVIKIDVEGAELAVLRGARDTITAAGDRLTLFVEMHPALWSEAGYTLHDLQIECARMGLEPQSICGGDRWGTEGVCVMLRKKHR
jgi:FkbM family methyltransferase